MDLPCPLAIRLAGTFNNPQSSRTVAKATESNNSCIFYIFPFFKVSKIFERLLSSCRLMMESDGLAAHRRKHHNLGSAHWHLPVRLRVLPSWPLISAALLAADAERFGDQ
jgi:hypothetical protein